MDSFPVNLHEPEATPMVFSQGMFGRFYREPDMYSGEVSQYEDIFRAFDICKTFTEGGYEIRIYHVTGQ